jgi:hypothetical protein
MSMLISQSPLGIASSVASGIEESISRIPDIQSINVTLSFKIFNSSHTEFNTIKINEDINLDSDFSEKILNLFNSCTRTLKFYPDNFTQVSCKVWIESLRGNEGSMASQIIYRDKGSTSNPEWMQKVFS